jgi:hypothetical protein
MRVRLRDGVEAARLPDGGVLPVMRQIASEACGPTLKQATADPYNRLN